MDEKKLQSGFGARMLCSISSGPCALGGCRRKGLSIHLLRIVCFARHPQSITSAFVMVCKGLCQKFMSEITSEERSIQKGLQRWHWDRRFPVCHIFGSPRTHCARVYFDCRDNQHWEQCIFQRDSNGGSAGKARQDVCHSLAASG